MPMHLWKRGFLRQRIEFLIEMCAIRNAKKILLKRLDFFGAFLLRQQKSLICLPDKLGFFNDICLRQMILAPPMMMATPNDVCLTAHYGKHRIIASETSNIIFAKQMHHIAVGDTSLIDIPAIL